MTLPVPAVLIIGLLSDEFVRRVRSVWMGVNYIRVYRCFFLGIIVLQHSDIGLGATCSLDGSPSSAFCLLEHDANLDVTVWS